MTLELPDETLQPPTAMSAVWLAVNNKANAPARLKLNPKPCVRLLANSSRRVSNCITLFPVPAAEDRSTFPIECSRQNCKGDIKLQASWLKLRPRSTARMYEVEPLLCHLTWPGIEPPVVMAFAGECPRADYCRFSTGLVPGVNEEIGSESGYRWLRHGGFQEMSALGIECVRHGTHRPQ